MKKKAKINSYIEKLSSSITRAELNYDIWRVYKTKQYRKLLLQASHNYPNFFPVSVHAHFVAMVIALYRLLENRNDTVNFNQLIIVVKHNTHFTKRDIANIQRRINSILPLWKKIEILRNNIFGHETNQFTINPWTVAKITPNNVKKIIEKYKNLLNCISKKWNGKHYMFSLSASAHTKGLLKDLNKINKL